MPLAKKKEKKKTPTWFLTAIIIMMLIVFVIQLLFPTNVGKFFNENLLEASEITVIVVENEKESCSYYTDSVDEMFDLINWAGEYKMRNKSIADSLTPDAKKITQYNFAIENSDGSYVGIVIDAKGYVHTGARLYKVIDKDGKFIDELGAELESWENNK